MLQGGLKSSVRGGVGEADELARREVILKEDSLNKARRLATLTS